MLEWGIPPRPGQGAPNLVGNRPSRRAVRIIQGGSATPGEESVARTTRSVLVRKEPARYLQEPMEPDVDDDLFSRVLRRRTSLMTCADLSEIIDKTVMPHLGLIARLYNEIESTSCQAESFTHALAGHCAPAQLNAPHQGRENYVQSSQQAIHPRGASILEGYCGEES